MKRLLIPLLIFGIALLACSVFTLTATPDNWLYQHNYYFRDLVNALR